MTDRSLSDRVTAAASTFKKEMSGDTSHRPTDSIDIDDQEISSSDTLIRRLAAKSQDFDDLVLKLEGETTLSEHEAVIVAGEFLGWSHDDIGLEIARGPGYVQDELHELRKKREELADELDDIENTVETLSEI